jgi:hypothetical protein
MELDDNPTRLVQVESFPADLALCDQDPRRRAAPVERRLDVPPRLPAGGALQKSGV